MHLGTDIEERGQVPNVSQLDASQTDRQTDQERKERGGEQLRFCYRAIIKKHFRIYRVDYPGHKHCSYRLCKGKYSHVGLKHAE